METRLTPEVMKRLSEPFAPDLVSWKPQAVSQDGTRALAVAYVDVRDYQERLNAVVGADWSDDYEVIHNGAVILCRLTVAGVTRADIGESDPDEQNVATSAIAQAFKRACVKFGLGAYLYRLPKTWAEYDPQRKTFTPAGLAQLQKLAGGPETATRFGDGGAVPENARPYYQAYVQALGQPPANLEALREWARLQRGNGK